MTAFPFIQNSEATAFLFPGQGSQQVGMAADLTAHYAVAKATFAEADELLGFALSTLCFEGPEAALTDTINAQPALLATSVALLRVLAQELGEGGSSTSIGNTFVAGHSMGEYSALVAAGTLSFADGLRLVRERGRLMKLAGERNPGLMAAILGLDEAVVAQICAEASQDGKIVQVANDNCPGQAVISGDQAGMEAAMAALRAAGARKVVPLAVSIAAHCPLMQPAADELAAAIAATPLASPTIPVIGNTTAQPLTTVDAIRAELRAQLTGSVRWTASIQYALQAGVTRFVEIGPDDVLTSMIKRIDRTAQRQAISTPADVQNFVQAWPSA